MREFRAVIAGAVWLLWALWGPTAASAGQPPGSEGRIRSALQRLDRAAEVVGESRALDRMSADFKVTSRAVEELRDQKLDIGEVAAVLALAEMGAASPDTILSWWASGRLSWGKIAERLPGGARRLQQRLEQARRAMNRPVR